ncbi:MAG: pantoate--beta-alanine ligase [Bacteroidota bacterium]
MIIIREVDLLQSIIHAQATEQRTVGFTPTMGALHPGHLSLIEKSNATTDISVCSIFVNPTQFNESSDLEKYPQTPQADIQALESVGCDILFMPSVESVYPSGMEQSPAVDLGHLDKVLEAAFRPGHFEGVVQVVSRLLDIVQPDHLFMGQKDYQQLAIIREMIKQQGRRVQLIMGETVREASGLAMSSRNVRLTEAFRLKAPSIYQMLQAAKKVLATDPINTIEQRSIQKLQAIGLKPEYFSIVDGDTLRPVDDEKASKSIVACTAVWAGDVRLIDNFILR